MIQYRHERDIDGNITPTVRLTMDFEDGKKEYTLDEAAVLVNEAVPDLEINRGQVYKWVIQQQEKNKIEFRRFPRSLNSTRYVYRITQNGLDRLIKLAQQWAREVKGEEFYGNQQQ